MFIFMKSDSEDQPNPLNSSTDPTSRSKTTALNPKDSSTNPNIDTIDNVQVQIQMENDDLQKNQTLINRLKNNPTFKYFLQSRFYKYCICISCCKLSISEIRLCTEKRRYESKRREFEELQARNRAQSSVYSMGGNAGSMTGMSEMTNLMTGQQQQSGAIQQQVSQDQNSQALGFDGAGLGYLQPGLIGTGIVWMCKYSR